MMMLVMIQKLWRFGNLAWIRLHNAWWLMILPGAILFDALNSSCPHMVRRHRRHPLMTSTLLAVVVWLGLAIAVMWLLIMVQHFPRFWSFATHTVSRACAKAWVLGKTISEKNTMMRNHSDSGLAESYLVFEKNIVINDSPMSATVALCNAGHISIIAGLVLLKNILTCGLWCPRCVGFTMMVLLCLVIC